MAAGDQCLNQRTMPEPQFAQGVHLHLHHDGQVSIVLQFEPIYIV